ncbi:DUF4326 domain-containing protein [Azospirillaceae bacterium]
MPHPLVVNIKFSKCDVYCGRSRDPSKPSKWGNQFIIGRDGNRSEVIYKHKWLQLPKLVRDIGELKGKVLGCYCAPLACHCDIYAELSNDKEALKQYLRELIGKNITNV